MYMIIKVENEEYKIPLEVPEDYNPTWNLEEDEFGEDGYDHSQSVLGFGA